MTQERYFGFMPNDFINGVGVCVSIWTAGCPHHCPGCHNPETWNRENGAIIEPTYLADRLIKAISANGIQRNFSILGGEPLMEENLNFVAYLIERIRKAYPDIKIILWTGDIIEKLQIRRKVNNALDYILNNIDILIDGPYLQEERDTTLKLRGSSNQRILYRKKGDF